MRARKENPPPKRGIRSLETIVIDRSTDGNLVVDTREIEKLSHNIEALGLYLTIAAYEEDSHVDVSFLCSLKKISPKRCEELVAYLVKEGHLEYHEVSHE